MTIFLDASTGELEGVVDAPVAADGSPPGTEEQSAHRQLHDLGYANGESLEDKVRAFQQDCGQNPTGQLADAQDELNRRFAACDPPSRAPAAG